MKDERRRLPGQHRHGGQPERARGGDGPPPALRPPLQQGPDDLRGLRRARSASCGCGTACRPSSPWSRSRRPRKAGRLGEPVFVVFNPRSGKGRGARLVQPVLEALRAPRASPSEHALTAQAGDEAELAAARGRERLPQDRGGGRRRHLEQRRQRRPAVAAQPARAGPGARRHRLRPGQVARHPRQRRGRLRRASSTTAATRAIDVGPHRRTATS